MNIACITYRSWASDIYNKIKDVYENKHSFLIWHSKEEFDTDKLIAFEPDIILWYGWSWMVDDIFINDYDSVMLHPSPLPKYRGGSPIQNQIINGEKTSAVSLFKMTSELDKGDIYVQLPMALQGSLMEIFSRISDLGFSATCSIIEGNYKLTPQNHEDSTYCKRRKPSDSEITLDEIKNNSAEYIHNKVRMLNDPYPNAYITTRDGDRLYLIQTKLEQRSQASI